jgi:hypothetical protein
VSNERRDSRGRERWVLAWACAALAVGLATNEWVVASVWGDASLLEGRERLLGLRLLSAAGIVVGGLLLALRRWIATHLIPLLAAGLTLAVMLGLFLTVDLFIGYRFMTPSKRGEEMDTLHRPDERLGWLPVPGAVARHRFEGSFDVEYRVDAEGFRAVPHEGVAERTVYFFGDSYTFGFGVGNEQTYTAIIAREYLKPRVRVVNAGVNGYGIVQMYGRLQDLAGRLTPGDVVVFAPIADDLRRNLDDFVFIAPQIWRVETLRYPSFEDGEVRSVVVDGIWNRIRSLFLHAMISEGFFRFVHRAWQGDTVIREARAVFAAARAVCAERGVHFLVAFLPKVKDLTRDAYEVEISSFDYLDLRADFPKEKQAARALRFATNAHWNAAGHALAARALVRALVDADALAPEDLRKDPGGSE